MGNSLGYFNQELDRIVQNQAGEEANFPPAENQQVLWLARQLAEIDFSHESHIRQQLRLRLAEKINVLWGTEPGYRVSSFNRNASWIRLTVLTILVLGFVFGVISPWLSSPLPTLAYSSIGTPSAMIPSPAVSNLHPPAYPPQPIPTPGVSAHLITLTPLSSTTVPFTTNHPTYTPTISNP
jgi:hypothetical protein